MRCTTRESSLTIVTCFKYLVKHSLISWRKLFLFVTLIKWIESCYLVEMTVFNVVFSTNWGKRESGKFKSFSGDRKVEKNNNNRRPTKTKQKKFKQFVLKQLIFNVTISVCRNAWFKNHSSLMYTYANSIFLAYFSYTEMVTCICVWQKDAICFTLMGAIFKRS